MKAIIKSIYSIEHKVETFMPEDPNCFCLDLRLDIGSDDSIGADNFELLICTPEWLCKHNWTPTWGRHMLIVREYNWVEIEQFISQYITQCDGVDWSSIALKISRVLSWEYEDYKP